ncbi:glycoside hydrolase family 17 protein [Hyaloscypha hepaticicola]|uniref:Probable glucan endo-1,3-beta-glucosidase eglC n=1 Tax=Hyaloscypha hepaticicola TaxID=2082293 RepID=A0A2J6PEG5_9HELO|nr:glycoside hydrolase family 17 protein [Hyaloscypha hepaticicola]
MRSSGLLALAASLSTTTAVYQGFNYGSTKSDGTTFRYQADFQSLFQTAKNLVGTSGFTSARLYTMIQGGSSTNEPTQAIPAAIAEDTTLLLGLWASGGEGGIEAEISALQSAITKYGTAFTSLVAGISVGSEDLYRISPTGIAAHSGYGADPVTIASYISQVRTAIAGTPLSGASIGHVDTWTAWVNSSNQAVIDACDWIGMDAYPYFQTTQANSIQNGPGLFQDALSATQAAVGGKPVWVTETGWPVSGSTANLAVPSAANAKTYWDAVGCPLFGKTNTWWYTLTDNDAVQTNPSFGIVDGNPLSTTPYFDLSCSAVSSSSSSTPSTTTSSGTSGGSSGSASASISASVASVVSVATNSPLASSGGGLSPSLGAGNGIGSASGTGVAPTGTGTGSSGSGSGSNSTATLKTTASPTGSSTSSSGPAIASANAASHLASSVVGAIGALIVAAAAL